MPTDTRDRLLAAAWECVRRGGPAAATSRAITAAAGANLGAITYHFGSKDALLAEAVGAAIETLVEPALDALRDESARSRGPPARSRRPAATGLRRSRRRRARVPRGLDREPPAPGAAGARRRGVRPDPDRAHRGDRRSADRQALPDWVDARVDGRAARSRSRKASCCRRRSTTRARARPRWPNSSRDCCSPAVRVT